MDFKMMLELYNPENDEHSIALSLPASDYQIQDALDQIRVYGENARCNISIAHCNVLPELVGARIDSQNVFEVNYFAHRLKNISEKMSSSTKTSSGTKLSTRSSITFTMRKSQRARLLTSSHRAKNSTLCPNTWVTAFSSLTVSST